MSTLCIAQLLFVSVLLFQIRNISGQQFTLLGYDLIVIEEENLIKNISVIEMSGLSFNNRDDGNQTIFYGMSNALFQKEKLLFEFPINLSASLKSPRININQVTGVIMKDPPNLDLREADTENIVYLRDDNDEIFFIVCNEGYREWDTQTNFWLFSDKGDYVANLSYNTDIFQERGNFVNRISGFDENHGIESMSISSDYQTVVWIASNTLVQDQSFANKTVE